MAVATVKSGNLLVWTGAVSPFPPKVSVVHVVRSEEGLRAVLKGTENNGIAYLKIEVFTNRLIMLIQELAQGRRSKKIRVGKLIVDMYRVCAENLQHLLCFLCLQSVSLGKNTCLQGRRTQLLDIKLKVKPHIRLYSYAREMVVVKNLMREEFPFYGICVRNVLNLGRYVDEVGTLILRDISLDELLEIGGIGGFSNEKRELWSVFDQVREIRLKNCSFTMSGICRLLCFFLLGA